MSDQDAPDQSIGGMALSVTALETGYGRTTVLRDVTIEVPSGSAVALLGPNGAGKTTLLRAISGFLPATRGHIRLGGVDVTTAKPYKRFANGLCHVPEGRGIFRGLTVRENILVQSVPGTEEAALEKATTAFPVLGRRLEQRAGTMSGGEQQMLALTAAYVRDPRVVLVDEASLGLAPLIVDEIFEFLQNLTTQGRALLIVDQFAVRALAMAQHAYVLRRGSIVHSGPAASLMDGDVFDKYLGTETTGP